eukprot:CAMPEP_0114174446 /NCGR_PEP_ID=MMETSP0043_2-20121206/36413_1 /TAXON_ID=464988 /ORGANISM="Hemiselmis andersenii, Strain CCMP644" /LENGTH=73 /DNA_ID=CAMNT_0001272589 /DNA_START=101 /DNA_END=318 /DNA_ORIENTATION=-
MASHEPGEQWRGAENFEERHFERVGTFRGQVLAGKGLHGMGSFVYDSGDVYEGEWQMNQRHGIGRCVYADGKT